jgi:hypothetical protein
MAQDWESLYSSMRKMTRHADDMIRRAEDAMQSVKTEVVVDNGDHLIYRITAKPWSARWRLFKVFWRVAWALLFKGTSKLKVKKTIVVKDVGHPEYGQTGRMRSDAPNYSNPPVSSKPKP